jgi:hypothetical protein
MKKYCFNKKSLSISIVEICSEDDQFVYVHTDLNSRIPIHKDGYLTFFNTFSDAKTELIKSIIYKRNLYKKEFLKYDELLSSIISIDYMNNHNFMVTLSEFNLKE